MQVTLIEAFRNEVRRHWGRNIKQHAAMQSSLWYLQAVEGWTELPGAGRPLVPAGLSSQCWFKRWESDPTLGVLKHSVIWWKLILWWLSQSWAYNKGCLNLSEEQRRLKTGRKWLHRNSLQSRCDIFHKIGSIDWLKRTRFMRRVWRRFHCRKSLQLYRLQTSPDCKARLLSLLRKRYILYFFRWRNNLECLTFQVSPVYVC